MATRSILPLTREEVHDRSAKKGIVTKNCLAHFFYSKKREKTGTFFPLLGDTGRYVPRFVVYIVPRRTKKVFRKEKPRVVNKFSFWTTFSVDKNRKTLKISNITKSFGKLCEFF